jgi:DNA polymerase-3 subunit epsilon
MPRRLIGRLAGLLPAPNRTPRTVAAHHFATDEPLASLPATVFDTETTGLHVGRDRIVSVGGLQLRGGQPESAPPLDFLVHPGLRIPKTASAIHGIDDRMVATAPPITLLWPGLQLYWQQRVMIGHNIAFDLALLRHEAERHRLPFHPPAGALDIGLLFAGLRPRQDAITLEKIADHFGIAIAGRHSALGDAAACAEIWTRMLPALQHIGVATLGAARGLMQRQRDLVHGQHRAGWAIDLMLPS